MQRKEAGAVSIFVVIFAALLVTVVTVSFIRIMVNDQNQATNNDLSQSAFDSALAGVEDAKRALLRYVSVCANDGQAACDALAQQLVTDECNAAVRIGDVIGSDSEAADPNGATGEIKIQQSTSATDQVLDQAYTCVTIDLETPDYIGTIAANQSKLLPLIGKAANGSNTFNRVVIEWFSREDLSNPTAGTVVLSNLPSPRPLLDQTDWDGNTPSVLKASLIQHADTFTVQDFDAMPSSTSNTNTVFLYPTAGAANNLQSFSTVDNRRNSPSADTPADSDSYSPSAVQCQRTITSGGYACQVTLMLPQPIGGGNDRNAYLRLTPFYNATHFRVTLANGATRLNFNGVQPEIDSTGRANDLFRRIGTRVDLIDTSFPYPDAALEVGGNLCKSFAVTDTAYYSGTGAEACTP